jgi:hypothetical protein
VGQERTLNAHSVPDGHLITACLDEPSLRVSVGGAGRQGVRGSSSSSGSGSDWRGRASGGGSSRVR